MNSQPEKRLNAVAEMLDTLSAGLTEPKNEIPISYLLVCELGILAAVARTGDDVDDALKTAALLAIGAAVTRGKTTSI